MLVIIRYEFRDFPFPPPIGETMNIYNIDRGALLLMNKLSVDYNENAIKTDQLDDACGKYR